MSRPGRRSRHVRSYSPLAGHGQCSPQHRHDGAFDDGDNKYGGEAPPKSFQTDSPQPAPQAAPDQAAQPSGPASPTDQLDLLNGIGKLFGDPSSIFPAFPTLKRETIDDLNARAKDATDGLSRLTAPLIARGRMMCPASADGAPDCKVASDKLCQAKGFKEGESLDTDSAQSCSAAALLSGGNREPGNCRTNHYVTRALCQ